MAGRRLYYLLTLTVSLFLYIVIGSWLSFVLLIGIAGLPWLSLLLSIPAIRGFRLSPTGVDVLEAGEAAELWLLGSCDAPMPPFRGNIRLRSRMSGEAFRYLPEKGFPTAHCGGWQVSTQKGRVCDYMGIFTFRPRQVGEKTILVRPHPVPVAGQPDLQNTRVHRWHPKKGGGFSENHELRPYRPGDDMNGVHWKLSEKTGSLMVREPMEPEQGRILLTADLNGTPEELDRKLGRLFWMGRELLTRQIAFEVRVLTGQGILNLSVSDERELYKTVDSLLCQELAGAGSVLDHPVTAFWQYHIGGASDEA